MSCSISSLPRNVYSNVGLKYCRVAALAFAKTGAGSPSQIWKILGETPAIIDDRQKGRRGNERWTARVHDLDRLGRSQCSSPVEGSTAPCTKRLRLVLRSSNDGMG